LAFGVAALHITLAREEDKSALEPMRVIRRSPL